MEYTQETQLILSSLNKGRKELADMRSYVSFFAAAISFFLRSERLFVTAIVTKINNTT